MVDTTLLLKNLEDYRDSLRRHVASTREEFSRLQSDWMVLVDVYEGAGADHFHSIWKRTAERFADYIDRSDAIRAQLDAKIEILRDFDRPI